MSAWVKPGGAIDRFGFQKKRPEGSHETLKNLEINLRDGAYMLFRIKSSLLISAQHEGMPGWKLG
jgi:hypothetical protein